MRPVCSLVANLRLAFFDDNSLSTELKIPAKFVDFQTIEYNVSCAKKMTCHFLYTRVQM